MIDVITSIEIPGSSESSAVPAGVNKFGDLPSFFEFRYGYLRFNGPGNHW